MKDDTINRQAAIDAAINAADEWDGGCIPSRQDMIEKAINKLPSAEATMLVLPCKVGDTVYVLVREGGIKKYIVSGIIIDYNNTWIETREIDNPYGGGLLNVLQFGESFFHNREDAEAALGGKK